MNMTAMMTDPRNVHMQRQLSTSSTISAVKRKFPSIDPDESMIDDNEDGYEEDEEENDENQDISNMQLNSSSLSTSLLHTFQANVNVKTPARHNQNSVLR